jgi:hypothetical protein
VTAPQLPAGWGGTPAPAAPAGYPPAPAYPYPTQPPAPQYAPQAYAPPQQPYPPQFAPQPGYPPMGQQYAPQQPAAPAGPAPQTGTLADYANQPEAGASFWKFKNPGDTNTGVVSRDLVDTDTVERTFRGQVQKRFDGSSDWVLRIPMTNADGTDGVWEVGGKDRTTLKNALIAAGKADGIPAKGWAIRATFTHFQQNSQGQPSRIKEIQVAPPNGQAQPALPTTVAPQAQAQAAQQIVQQPPAQPAQDPQYAAWLASQGQGAPQQPAPAQQFAAPPAAAAYPQTQPAPAPQAAPAPQQFQPPQGMPADAAAQFSAMLGGAAPAQG